MSQVSELNISAFLKQERSVIFCVTKLPTQSIMHFCILMICP